MIRPVDHYDYTDYLINIIRIKTIKYQYSYTFLSHYF